MKTNDLDWYDIMGVRRPGTDICLKNGDLVIEHIPAINSKQQNMNSAASNVKKILDRHILIHYLLSSVYKKIRKIIP